MSTERNKSSRTYNSIRNTGYSFLYKVLDLIMAFVLRPFVIRYFGMHVIGLHGLFTNILTVLSLAEAGIGGAFVFSLYKPLAEEDREQIHILMKLYRKVYFIVAILIAFVGFGLTPFLDYFVNFPSGVEHIGIIYWLTILNVVLSYFGADKRSLLIADQRSDINTKNQFFFRITRFALLILVTVFTKNYLLYLTADIGNSLISNIHITSLTRKKYPYLKTKCAGTLGEREKKSILKFVSSGLIFKIGQTVVTSTDNIIISIYFGTIMVAYYSNYSMILGSLEVFVYLLFNSITASIGNFSVTKDNTAAEKLFNRVQFINFFVAFSLTFCLIPLIKPFTILWLGEGFDMENGSMYIVILNFYIAAMQKGIESFLSAKGELFYRNRYRGAVEAVVNLTVSLILARYTPLGLTGVFLGTTACYICGRIWMDVRVLYKYWFIRPVWGYFKKYFFFLALTGIACTINAFLGELYFELWNVTILSWVIYGFFSVIVSLLTVCLLFRNKEEFRYLCDRFLRKIQY